MPEGGDPRSRSDEVRAPGGGVAASPRTSPPSPRLVFRVGVVGHRPNRLRLADPVLLTRTIGSLLDDIQRQVSAFQGAHEDLYAGGPAVLRIVSPLAEGADRIVAREALDLGYQLQCPMPFPQEEYENDFRDPRAQSPSALQEFRDLLARGDGVGECVRFELDGDRTDEAAAYGATGRVVLNQSDIFLVVWDGGPAQGGGGTVEKLHEALRFGLPVIWIDAITPHACRVLRSPEDLPQPHGGSPLPGVPAALSAADVGQLVIEILQPPQPRSNGRRTGAPDLRARYFREKRPRLSLATVWKHFRDLVGDGTAHWRSIRVPDFERATESSWPSNCGGVAHWANCALRTYYAWADGLANLYGDRHRSAFISAFLLSVLAVTFALVPLTRGTLEQERPVQALPVAAVSAPGAPPVAAPALHPTSPVPASTRGATRVSGHTIAEVVTLLMILGLIGSSWRFRWHARWMEYRIVAELVRQLRFLLPLGGGRPFPRASPLLAHYGDPARTWMYWHVRGIEREAGLPRARVDRAYVQASLEYALGVCREQLGYHRETAARCARIEHGLHRFAFALFFATLLGCLLHMARVMPWAEALATQIHRYASPRALAALGAIFPALAAALAGINNQGEFGRIAKRSRAMADRLQQLEGEISALSQRPDVRSREAIDVTWGLAQLMVDEVLDWRVVFKDRPPVLPA